MNMKEPWYFSWITIVIAFIFFWPVGVALIILKSQRKTKNSVFTGGTNKNIYLIAGVILILWGITRLRGSVFWGLFMIVGGGLLIYYAEKLAKRAVRNRQYINLVVNQGETSIDKIASICNVQYAVAVKELNQLVSLNVLKNTRIDEMQHKIVINRPQLEKQNGGTIAGALQEFGNEIQKSFGTEGNINANTKPESKTVACSGCGAKVLVYKGQVITCEYCDTPISFQ